MPTNPTATSLLPFEEPVHALVPMVAGLLCWMFGTAAREISKRPDQFREMSRHNPWTVLFKGRAKTNHEETKALPDGFFSVYSAFGFTAVVIGYGLGGLGLVALAVSLSKKLF